LQKARKLISLMLCFFSFGSTCCSRLTATLPFCRNTSDCPSARKGHWVGEGGERGVGGGADPELRNIGFGRPHFAIPSAQAVNRQAPEHCRNVCVCVSYPSPVIQMNLKAFFGLMVVFKSSSAHVRECDDEMKRG
jgi:hypothetical protein